MKNILIAFLLLFSIAGNAQVQYGGVIRAQNNTGAIGTIGRTNDNIKTNDSALNLKIPVLTLIGTGLKVDGSSVIQPVSGTFFQTTQPVSIATMPSTPVTGTFFQATQPISPQAITKGTQGTTGITTQDLKDAGRNQIHFYMLIPVLTSATDALQSLTGTKSGATVVATVTPAVVTAGKTLRITRIAGSYISTATSGYGIVRLRFNTAGLAAITSPIATTLVIGNSAPVTVNASDSEEASLSEGWEFAAGTGIGISVQGFAAATGTAVGYILVSVTGYEY